MNSKTKVNTIRIGVYGPTQVGKTRFLYELLKHLEKQRRIVKQGLGFHDFMRWAESSVEKNGDTKGTTQRRRIEFTYVVESQLNNETDEKREIIIHDLSGEELEREIDVIESLCNDKLASLTDDNNQKKQILLPTQVKECDAFLFFFDPSRWENPAWIDEHHKRESIRSSEFIKNVLINRENRYLPILFLATRLDVWENDSVIDQKCESWFSSTHATMSDLYSQKLISHFPKKLTDKSETFMKISSIRSDMTETVIEKIRELVLDCNEFNDKNKSKNDKILRFFIVPSLIVIGFIFIWMIFASSGTYTSPNDSSSLVSLESDQSVFVRITNLNDHLQKSPKTVGQITEKDTSYLNKELDLLVQASLSRQRQTESNKSSEKINQAISEVSIYLLSLLPENPVDYAEYLNHLEKYLSGIPDGKSFSRELSEVQEKYWDLEKVAIQREISEIIKNRTELKSPYHQTIRELKEKLSDFIAHIDVSKVYGSSNRKSLIDIIRKTMVFLDDREKTGYYTINLRIKSAKLKTQNPNHNTFHSFEIKSDSNSQKNSQLIKLTPKVDGNDEIKFGTKAEFYRLKVSMGDYVECVLFSQDQQNNSWNEKCRFDFSNFGPLRSLGMPLMCIETEERRYFNDSGYTLTIEIRPDSAIPSLLAKSVESR